MLAHLFIHSNQTGAEQVQHCIEDMLNETGPSISNVTTDDSERVMRK